MNTEEKAEMFREWFVEGISRGASHLIISYNEYDGLHPIYVFPEQPIKNEVEKYASDPYYNIDCVMDLIRSREDQVYAAAAPKNRLTSFA